MSGKTASQRIWCLSVLVLLCALALAPTTWAAPSTVEIQLLSINDLHGNLLPKGTAGGVANLAAYFRDKEAANPNTLIVEAGDMVGGSPVISALLQDEPTVEVLQLLGVDVGAPGNHTFDEGVSELLRLQYGGRHQATGYFPGSGYPLVCANVVDKKTNDPILPPYVIKVVGGVPVGLIGVVSLETPGIVIPTGVANVAFTDPVVAINNYVQVLKSKGVETIVVVAHEGGSQDAKTGEITGVIRTMVEQISSAVDVVISGHSHTVLNGKVAGKVVVQAGANGANFTDVDLVIDKATGDVVEARSEIVKVEVGKVTPDPVVAKLVAGYEAKVKPLQDRVVGEVAGALSRGANTAGESVLGDLVADSQRKVMGTQVAFMNPGGIRADIDAGVITWGELYSVQPFGNNLVRMTMNGDQIRRLLNQQWQKQGEQVITRMLQISGLKYSWDDSRAFGNKVVDIWLEDGTLVNAATVVTVAANYFLAVGGDGFAAFTESKDQITEMVDLDAFVAYIGGLSKPFSYSLANRIVRLK